MAFFDTTYTRPAVSMSQRLWSFPWIPTLLVSCIFALFLWAVSQQPLLWEPLWYWYVLCGAAPAFAANMTPPGAAKLVAKLSGGEKHMPWWSVKPICESRLGKGKTWFGLVLATLMGGLIAWLQYQLAQSEFLDWLLPFPLYRPLFLVEGISGLTLVLLGLLVGFAALFADAIESRIKRWLQIKPGMLWYPWDYWDFIFGKAVVLVPIWFLGLTTLLSAAETVTAILWLLTFSAVVLPVTAEIFCRLGLKKRG